MPLFHLFAIKSGQTHEYIVRKRISKRAYFRRIRLTEIFEKVADFRNEKFVSYKLSELLLIAFCAVLSGADDYEEIAEYGRPKESFFRKFMELPNGTPSHDIFNRVFRNMDTKSFESCLTKWSKELLSQLTHYQINIDGKILKATGVRGKKTAAIGIVSAWGAEHCLSLGQSKVHKKSNEKIAIPELIEAIDIAEQLVSIDAMDCDKKTAFLIRENEGDCLPTLNENQKNLHEEVRDWMQKHKDLMDSYTQTDYVGGRIEKRTAYVNNNLTYINEAQGWTDSKTIVLVEREPIFKNGEQKNTFQSRYYISSVDKNAEYFERCIRNHWSIENQLHCYLDVVFNEVRQRVREDNGAENMTTLRKMGLQTLIQHKGNKSLKVTRKKVVWNETFMEEILFNF